MYLTFDTNCIIDLEENRPAAPSVTALISLHNQQKIDVRVIAISASERKLNGTYASNFAEFQQKIAAVGLQDVEILRPLGYWDIAFYDWCVRADDQIIEFERKIHKILFPQIDFDYRDFCNNKGINPNSGHIDHQWLNAKCDVLSMWCHIHYDGDIFVTSDRNFHKQTKKPVLIALGAKDILTPQGALVKINQRQS
jgi:hypothetical protein